VTDERTIAKFLRGLTIGALLGAVVAGSRIWTRWSARDRAPAREDRRGG
jgi:hypothetical protein